MILDENDLEECTFMDEEFFRTKGNIHYDQETENLQLNIPMTETIVDSESLQLMILDQKVSRLQERIQKIEDLLEWQNID